MWNLWALLTGRRKPADHDKTEQTAEDGASAAEESPVTDGVSEPDEASEHDEAPVNDEASEHDEEPVNDEASETDEAPEHDEASASDETWDSEKPEKRRSLYDRCSGHGKKRKAPKIKKVPVALSGQVTLGEGSAKICVPVAGSADSELEEQARAAAEAGADVVEWRADYYDAIRDTAAAEGALQRIHEILGDIPILFTYRTSREGGKGKADGEIYSGIVLWAAARPEVAVIDIEGLSNQYDAEVLVTKAKALGKPVIASAHFFDGTPKKNELADIFGCLQRTGADILKVAAMPEKSRDVLRMMDVSREMDGMTSCPLITISMGDLGKITRVSGNITGSCMTFGTAGAVTAPGQMTVENLRRVMEQVG